MVAIIRNNQKNQILQMLEENVVYTISNLKVVQGPKLCRTADVNYVFNFFYRTKINKEVDTRVIPLYSFELQDYEAVAELVENVKVFIGEHIPSKVKLITLNSLHFTDNYNVNPQMSLVW